MKKSFIIVGNNIVNTVYYRSISNAIAAYLSILLPLSYIFGFIPTLIQAYWLQSPYILPNLASSYKTGIAYISKQSDCFFAAILFCSRRFFDQACPARSAVIGRFGK